MFEKAKKHFQDLKQKWMTANLYKAIDDCNHEGLCRLIKAGVDINRAKEGNDAPIFHAIYRRWRKGIETLIDAGVDLTVLNAEDKYTPYLAAVFFGEGICVEKIAPKSDLFVRDDCGNTALHLAAWWGNEKKLDFMGVDNKEILNAQNEDGETPIMVGVRHNCGASFVNKLKEKGADLSIKNKDGKTVFDLALELDKHRPMTVLEALTNKRVISKSFERQR